MNREECFSFIADKIAEMGVERSEITEESDPYELGLDELYLVELLNALEEQCGIVIGLNEQDRCKTIGNLIDLVVSKFGHDQ